MKKFDTSEPQKRIIPDVLDWQAEHNGDAVWLMDDARRLTFRECARLSERYACGLHALGLEKGQTLVMLMEPSIELVLVAMATARLGGIFSTVNTDYHGAFLKEGLDQSMAKILVVDEGLAERLDKVTLEHVQHVVVAGEASARGRPLASLLDAPPDRPAVELSWLDPVQVWWSSGTTGKSKGVMHAHSSILHLAGQGRLYADANPDDVFYSCTPMYLGSPWTGTIWPSLTAGVGAAIDKRFSATQFWERIRKYKATSFFTLGSMHMHLWNQPERPDDGASGVRHGQAIPLTWDMVPKFRSRFGIEHLDQAYGTSETFVVFQAPDDRVTPWQGAALGRPVDWLEVKLMDEFDREIPVGEAGEICIRPKGPGLMFVGYFNQPEVTVATWRNLWHHTGDMAFRDEEGVYYFADRKKDYIRYNGRNISMFEVEGVAQQHPDVEDVAAYGTASDTLESEAELTLCVVAKSGRQVSPEAVATFINENAPYYFVPRYIEFAEALPRNAHGRIMKHILRDRGLLPDAWDRKKAGFTTRR